MNSSLVHVLMLAAWSFMYPWLLWREFCRPVSSVAFNYIHKVAWVHSSIHKQNTTLAREHFEAKYSGVQWCCSKCTPDLLYTLIVSPLACYAVLLAHQVDILALCSWVPDMLQIKAHLCPAKNLWLKSALLSWPLSLHADLGSWENKADTQQVVAGRQ